MSFTGRPIEPRSGMLPRVALAALLAALLIVALAQDARAATCADHPNQASAQRAKDTRDADGDGIYCEALPCPCLKPGSSSPPPSSSPPSSRPAPRRTLVFSARITSVVDGDTVRVRSTSGRYYNVRLIGIDTPETRRPGTPIECGGPQATAYMKRLAPPGRAVVLTTDPTQATYDRYRRLLAYVRTSAGTLQLLQLNAGWAKVYVYGGRAFQRVGTFTAAQKRARAAGRGVWGSCAGNFHRPA